MKKNTIALVLSTVIGVNSIGSVGFAAANANAPAGIFDFYLADKADEKVEANLKQTLQQVSALIETMSGYKENIAADKENPHIATARLVIAIAGASLVTVNFRNKQTEAAFQLMTTAVLAGLSKALTLYASNRKFDLSLVSEAILDQQAQFTEAAKLAVLAGELSKEEADLINETVRDLQTINTDFQQVSEKLANTADDVGLVAAVSAVVVFVIHYYGKFLPKDVKEAVASEVQVISKFAQARAGGSVKVMGTTNYADLISQVAGMTSPEAEKIINDTLKNLYATQAEIITKLSAETKD